MSRWNLTYVLGILVLTSCASSHLEDGQLPDLRERQTGSPDVAGAAGSDTGSVRAGSAGFGDPASAAGGDVDTTLDGAGGPEPSDEPTRGLAGALAQGPAVWVGQLRTFSRVTCTAPDLNPPQASETFRTDVHFERVVLIAQRDPDTAALTVRIKIGEGTPPASPVELPPLDLPDAYWFCIFQFPSAGFEYTAIEPILSDDRLRFTFAPNELWSPWCESREFGCDGPCETFPRCRCGDDWCDEAFNNHVAVCQYSFANAGCECENGACWANLQNRVSVDLVTTNEGGLEGMGSLDNFAEFRLRRVQ